MSENFDALLVLSFGGPESAAEVLPFLENVARGRGIPRERLLAVAENYYRLDGRSPINEQCRALIAALRAELDSHGAKLPIYWGNRNWHPRLEATMRRMTADGVRRALIFVTSAYSGYAACRQYLEDVETARAAIGAGAPQFERLPQYCLRPGFVEPLIERDVRAALSEEAAAGATDVVVAPIGFIMDHMEVVFDLDTQAREHARALGLNMVRAGTVGTHPGFVAMIRELIEERLSGAAAAWMWPCLENCCPQPHPMGLPPGRPA